MDWDAYYTALDEYYLALEEYNQKLARDYCAKAWKNNNKFKIIHNLHSFYKANTHFCGNFLFRFVLGYAALLIIYPHRLQTRN